MTLKILWSVKNKRKTDDKLKQPVCAKHLHMLNLKERDKQVPAEKKQKRNTKITEHSYIENL